MEKISSRKHVSTGVLFAIRKIKHSQKLHATRYFTIELNLTWLSATTGVVPHLAAAGSVKNNFLFRRSFWRFFIVFRPNFLACSFRPRNQ